MKNAILKTTVMFVMVFADAGLQGEDKPPVAPEAKAVVADDGSKPVPISDAKLKALSIAQAVPKEMGFDLSKYLSIPLDKNEPVGVLNDSDIKPFLAPVALEADWWIVLFAPRNIKTGPSICVYVDKKLGVVRGYIIGQPAKQKQE